MHERLSGVGIYGPSHSSELTKPVKTRRTNSDDVLQYATLPYALQYVNADLTSLLKKLRTFLTVYTRPGTTKQVYLIE